MAFVDIYLRRDWMVPRRFLAYEISRGSVYIAETGTILIAWAVCNDGRLWNLLVHPKYRGQRIGGAFMEHLKPHMIHSKSDQSTGDPIQFYEKLGYKRTQTGTGRKHNIDIMEIDTC